MLNFPDLWYVSLYIHLTFKDVNNLFYSFVSSFPRPSGVVLMRPDYYTIPHLDEIDSLESEGQCVVEGFTIGRRGFGEVHFPGKTDVHGMNLDELGVCLCVCVCNFLFTTFCVYNFLSACVLSFCPNYIEVLGSHISLPFFRLTVLSSPHLMMNPLFIPTPNHMHTHTNMQYPLDTRRYQCTLTILTNLLREKV